jgi:hypothetical protein
MFLEQTGLAVNYQKNLKSKTMFEFLKSSSTVYSIARQNYFIQTSWVTVKQRYLATYLYGN